MRNVFFVLFGLFVSVSAQASGDSYVAAGLGGSSGGQGPAVSIGTLIAPPAIGVNLDVMNYGGGGHGAVGSVLGYIPIQEGAHAFIGAGVSYQSVTSASDVGIAYIVGLQFQSTDGVLVRLAAMQTQFNTANVNTFVFSIGKRF